jgi:hypothetical protein
MPLLDPHTSRKIGVLQLLDDAIAYRLDRLNLPCQACRPGARCADHRRDEELITGYTDTYAATLSDVLAGMDPDDIERMIRPGHHTPPTAGGVGTALMTRLRELAASGPVILELNGRTVMIDQDGPVPLDHPLAAGSGL